MVHEVKRKCRDFSELSKEPTAGWKAAEYRIFLLHAMPFVLDGILPDRYLHHALLFADAMLMLTQRIIKRSDLQMIHKKLRYYRVRL